MNGVFGSDTGAAGLVGLPTEKEATGAVSKLLRAAALLS
jgi:hypothetical protein